MAHHIQRDLFSLSDGDILDLQGIFLTNGYHTLSVPRVHVGRQLVCSLLSTLSCFSSVACLTLDQASLPDGVVNLYYQLISSTDMSSGDIDDYLLDNFYYDFLWIEQTLAISKESWFEHFMQRLYDFNLLKSLPIVVLKVV